MSDVGKTLALAAVAAIGVTTVRESLSDTSYRVKEKSDVYVLPPAEHVVALSLGHRAALADLLWAHILVSQGTHSQEKRRFENLTLLLDAINELEPTFREPYLMTDALVTFQTVETPYPEVVKAREIMERGLSRLPLDAELWLSTGQFVAFIAPAGYLPDEPTKKRWRIEGSKMLARAAELGGGDKSIAWQSIGGASLLGKNGERDAQIRFYQRACAVTDDPAFKKDCLTRLTQLQGEEEVARYKERRQAFDELKKKDLPFVGLSKRFLLGPPRDAAYCAGGAHADEPRCASSWRTWAEGMK